MVILNKIGKTVSNWPIFFTLSKNWGAGRSPANHNSINSLRELRPRRSRERGEATILTNFLQKLEHLLKKLHAVAPGGRRAPGSPAAARANVREAPGSLPSILEQNASKLLALRARALVIGHEGSKAQEAQLRELVPETKPRSGVGFAKQRTLPSVARHLVLRHFFKSAH